MRVIFTQTLKSCSIAAGVRVEWILKAVALQSESLEIGIDFINASGWLLHPGWCSYQSTSSISGGSSRCVMTPRMRSGHRSQYNTSPAALLQYRRLQLQPELRPLLHVVWPWEGLCFSAPCCQSNVELEWAVRWRSDLPLGLVLTVLTQTSWTCYVHAVTVLLVDLLHRNS